MYNAFMQGVQRFGLPSRIRTDQGRENILFACHMQRHRGCSRSSVLVGSSVHNQRIERLWRDLHRCVTGIYYRLFYYLEQGGLLNPLSEKDLLHCTMCTYQELINPLQLSLKAGTTMASKLPTTAHHCSFTQVAFCG